MENCKVCNKYFEPWMAEFECDKCDEYGLEERWRDWSFSEPDYIQCSQCGGNKIFNSKEHSFCSEECRENYFNKH